MLFIQAAVFNIESDTVSESELRSFERILTTLLK